MKPNKQKMHTKIVEASIDAILPFIRSAFGVQKIKFVSKMESIEMDLAPKMLR